MKRYFWNVLVSLDQLANTLAGGDPDETISSRMGKQTKDCKFCYLVCRVLHVFDKDHCKKSIEQDEGGQAL